jgi:predicted nucleic acid-binding protein
VTVYFDTSAFIPLLTEEMSSEAAEDMWQAADARIATRLLFVESKATLARKKHTDLDQALTDLWGDFLLIELGEDLMTLAGAAATEFGLRGFDAVHCAAGASLGTESVVLASADRRLLSAWESLGCTTFDPNRN